MHENSGFLDTTTERELIKKPHVCSFLVTSCASTLVMAIKTCHCNSSHKDIHSLLTLCKI